MNTQNFLRSPRAVAESTQTSHFDEEDTSSNFDSSYQEFIFYQFYARWHDELGRRESWEESVQRFTSYMREKLGDKLVEDEYAAVESAILNREICPSMRLLWSAGEACEATNVTAYNCAYVAPKSWRDISEIMYISMCGAGCGFAAEEENVRMFPNIERQTGQKLPSIIIEDSKEGWCTAFTAACEAWTNGYEVELDYSKLRPAGARLYTMGGRSSGPEPLRELMEFAREKILSHQGEKLSTLDIHDIICEVGEVVVAGGVRRSALISLSALDDESIRDSKVGRFWETNRQRQLANNSAIYDQQPTWEEFDNEWQALRASGTGERGIFNRGGIKSQVPERRWNALQNESQIGMNPCGEIYLRSKQFCNLSSIVVRPEDTVDDLRRKTHLAALVGTYQATLTDYGYLDDTWRQNSEAEQLLGVSITGYFDNETVRNDDVLEMLKDEAVLTNAEYAERFGTNPSTAVTCVKPHGNSGQLLGVGSGMHPWFSEYFIRRVRISAADPLLQLAEEYNVPVYPEAGQDPANPRTKVLEFPVKAPDGAVTADKVSALDMLREWKRLKQHYTEHNPSVTIQIGDDEWDDVQRFVYDNWDVVGGLSFMPRSDAVYELAPYQSIDKAEYQRRANALGKIAFSHLALYETMDQTTGAKEMACVGGVCEI